MEFEIKNAEFQQKTAQEVRIRSDSGNGVDQPQAVTVSMKAEAFCIRLLRFWWRLYI